MLKTVGNWLNMPLRLRTIIIAAAVVGICAAIFISLGGVNVSADVPDGWISRHLLHYVFKRSEAVRSHGVIPPNDLTAPSRVRLGAQQFDMECSNCHGRPGYGQSVIALSMSPRPQYLPRVVGQFSDPELFRIVWHGVKYSAMPSWPTESRDDEVWSMVAFLRQLPKLDAQTYRDLAALPTNVKSTQIALGDAALRPANPHRNQPPFDEFLYAAPSAGFADQTIQDNPIASCSRCHGADGSGRATGGEAPNLTIQSAEYLRSALQAYTSGGRKSGFMQDIATQLSSTQIAALSNYYASLPVQTAAMPGADPALVKRGETIAMGGIPQLAIPACSTCHESQGSQIIGAPHLAGQSSTYLLRQLRAMGNGGRGSTVVWNPMFTVAHHLGDKDMVALAAYYSGSKPTKTSGNGQAAQLPPAPQPGQGAKMNIGEAKSIFAATCMKCHVNGGRGDLQGDYPNLTLQTAPYVAQSLYSFRTHDRRGGKMQEVTNALNFDQMASLAAYITSLTPQPALAKPDAKAASRGAAIAMNGVPSRGVPACLSCHDAKGVAALPLIPRLQGQNVLYLDKKLRYFSTPGIAFSALNPMPAIARRLTDGERADLAAYFAAAAPLQKPPRP